MSACTANKLLPKLLISIVFGILILSTYLIKEYLVFEDIVSCFSFYSFYAVFVYSVILVFTILKNKRFTLFHVFLLLTLAFYFGGQILVGLGYYHELSERVFSVVDERIPLEYKINAMSFILICVLLISIGYTLLAKAIKNGKERVPQANNSRRLDTLYKVGLLLFCVSIIPTIISLTRSIVLSVTYGHLGYREEKSEETGIWFLLSYLTGWFIPSCYMIAISKRGDKKRLIGYFGLILYSILYLMSGSRYKVIEIVFCILAIHYLWGRKKATFKSIVVGVGALFVIGVLLKAVGYAREASTGSAVFSIETIEEVFKENIIYQILYTTSTTFTTISNAMFRCPNEIAFNNGRGYLGAFMYMLPSFMRPDWMSSLNVDVEKVFSPLYYNWTVSGYGSSFLAEMYFNLGYFSYIASFLFGLFIAWVVNKIDSSIREDNPLVFFACIYLFSELIWGVRSDLFLVPRHMLLYVFIPAVLFWLWCGKRPDKYSSFQKTRAFER